MEEEQRIYSRCSEDDHAMMKYCRFCSDLSKKKNVNVCLEDEPAMKRSRFSSKKEKKNGEALLYLPDELLIEIFERLPVKSVLRFRCLAKPWSAILKSPTFIENQHRKQGRMLLTIRCSPLPHVDGSYDKKLLFHDLESPEVDTRPSLTTFIKDQCVAQFIGCCNGIVCISYGLLHILCNPALHEFNHLPPFFSDWPRDLKIRYKEQRGFAQGFGVTSDNVFKVILMHTINDKTNNIKGTMVHLYSSRTNSWRRLGDAPVTPRIHTVFLNGACHWLGHTFANNHKTILSFDIESEVFRQLELPDCLRRPDISDAFPIVLSNGCLGLVQCQDWFSESSEPAAVWGMKEYGVEESWIKLFSISLPPLTKTFLLPCKNDMLMVSVCGLPHELYTRDQKKYQLTSISLQTNEMKNTPLYRVQNSKGVLVYAESLITLN